MLLQSPEAALSLTIGWRNADESPGIPVKVTKMGPTDDPEAFLVMLESMAVIDQGELGCSVGPLLDHTVPRGVSDLDATTAQD